MSVGAVPLDRFSLSVGSMGSVSFAERLDAAAAGAYDAVGVSPAVLAAARTEGWSDPDLRVALADRGLAVSEIQVLYSWALEDPPRRREYEPRLFAVADALGGDYLIAVSDPPPEGDDLASERLAALAAARADEHGLVVAVEFLATGIDAPERAAAIVEASGASNAAVLFDTWHFHRGRADIDALRTVPAARIVAVQLAGVAPDAGADPVHETLHGRLLPGDGVDLVPTVRTLVDMGVRPSWAVEVLSDDLYAVGHALGPAAVGALTADRARRLVADARTGGGVPT